MNNNCIFCDIISKKVLSFLIWENDNFSAVLDINPINPGHLLILPKKHFSYVFDLNEKLYSELFQVAKEIAVPLKETTNAKRIGIAIEGFSVDHVHLHLVPVNHGNELDPNRAIPASKEDLGAMASKIKRAIEDRIQ